MFDQYDIIIVGGGHAGCEAALAGANMSKRVLLATMNMITIGQMSCNPAMGGVAKGQIVREIDALGGGSGIISDESMLQFRMLNKSKGPAMWSPRSQNDRMLFASKWRQMLESNPNIDFWQEMVTGLIVKEGRCIGVQTGIGLEIPSKSVILTNGTFLNGIIHIGEKQFGGGRAGERAATGLTEQLVSLGFESGRMKTGTPPRIDGRSLDYSRMEVQHGDSDPGKFSFLDTPRLTRQLPCHVTYTNPEVHHALKEGFHKSPMFNGRIRGLGPRYCPSIEDKIDRFAERDRHQLFVEPEGWDTCEIYVNGFSSSLPEDVQFRALRMVPGFENMKMFRPGYAIEYDFFQPTQLLPNLETKIVKNLFFAGQINGTTGYEEAASQGLMAGINAALQIDEKDSFILRRSDAYIGVLIDDLVNKGTKEPYRMFTSRAEYRILMRQDNADLRLTKKARDLGMGGLTERIERIRKKEEALRSISRYLTRQSVKPAEINEYLNRKGSSRLVQSVKLDNIVRRPKVHLRELREVLTCLDDFLSEYDVEFIESTEVGIKYEGYLEKEHEMAEKMNRLEEMILKEDLNYGTITSLSAEGREKLNTIRPRTLGQASRISGVSPSDISVLLIHIGR